MVVTIHSARSRKEALQMLESTFLNERAKRVNDDVCMELSFHLVKLRRASRNKQTTYSKVLTDLCTQISELSDIRTGKGVYRISWQSL